MLSFIKKRCSIELSDNRVSPITYKNFIKHHKKANITTIDDFHFSIVVEIHSNDWEEFFEFRKTHNILILKMEHQTHWGNGSRSIKYWFDLTGEDLVYKTMMVF